MSQPDPPPSMTLSDPVSELEFRPLADRMRPRSLAEFVGQQHLLAEGRPLRHALDRGQLHSMLFWGPPGTGKTTLARLLARRVGAEFMSLSAVLAGVKDIRAAIDRARALTDRAAVLFVDEVHRFNKAQQDAFLPHVENGTITLVGATTENPSFELNNALLSRARVYVLQALDAVDIRRLIDQALTDGERGLGRLRLDCEHRHRDDIAQAADGDGRRALNLLQVAADLATAAAGPPRITADIVNAVLSGGTRRFDKGGAMFYDQISALHKSVRGSSPDAALYWYARMLDGGCDPRYVARRVVRMAMEDVGLADPRGLRLALDACDVYERLGSPEGDLAIAQAIVYLACAAKSNAIYRAFTAAQAHVDASGSLEVPLHLRNAPTRLTRELGHGRSYRYAHDEPHGYAAGERYFPDDLAEQSYYQATDRGLEQKIAAKLAYLRALDRQMEDADSR